MYLERIPGLNEYVAFRYQCVIDTDHFRVTDAMQAAMKASGISTFDAVIPNEIGGMNAFEALLAAHRFNKATLEDRKSVV